MSDYSIVLASVSQDSPCGSNLYEDNAMEFALSKLANAGLGIQAESFVDGQLSKDSMTTGISAWSKMRDDVLDAFRQTKHLDLCYYLTLALARLEGLSGFISGIEVANSVLHHFWKDVHDTDSSGDFEYRQRSLSKLESNDITDSLGVIVVAMGKQLGTYTFADWLKATKDASPELTIIEQSISETLKDQPDFYDQIATQINELLQALDNLELTIKDHFATYRLTFKALRVHCARLAGLVSSYSEVNVTSIEIPSASGNLAAVSVKSTVGTDQISTREDVVKLLGKIITFYYKNEPTSPVPIMLERAQRVATMNFKDIVKEFNLSGTPSIQEVMGWRDDETY